jgi:hypothetical protein
MQVPTGVLVDHYGARRVLTIGAAVAAAGTLLFALSSSYALVGLGRLVLGAGVGVAFVAMLKLANHWVHPARFATVSGLALACGVVGGVSAGLPLRMAVDAIGWRQVMLFIHMAPFDGDPDDPKPTTACDSHPARMRLLHACRSGGVACHSGGGGAWRAAHRDEEDAAARRRRQRWQFYASARRCLGGEVRRAYRLHSDRHRCLERPRMAPRRSNLPWTADNPFARGEAT